MLIEAWDSEGMEPRPGSWFELQTDTKGKRVMITKGKEEKEVLGVIKKKRRGGARLLLPRV